MDVCRCLPLSSLRQRLKSYATVAQSWREGRGPREARAPKPLDSDALERLALRYVERFATSRAKLAAYLDRKLRERGWAGETAPDTKALAERMADLGYVDDRAFAAAKGSGLTRRGYGPRRVAVALKQAGIEEPDAEDAAIAARAAAWDAALHLARRKRIGPFAVAVPDRPAREKAIAVLLRAGHDLATARRIVGAQPGDELEPPDL